MVRDEEPARYEGAAVPVAEPLSLEAPNAGLEDLRRVAEALDALPDHPEAAMEQLSRLCVRYRLPGG